MPSSIPYDPSLVLGNIVDRQTLEKVRQISDIQAEADAKEDVLNNKISLKYSLDLTLIELLQMGTSSNNRGEDTNSNKNKENQKIAALKNQIAKLKQEIYDAAVDYAEVKSSVLDRVAKLEAKGTKKGGGNKKDGEGVVNYSMESPVDYARTNIKKMPLSADSLKLNAQYFSFEKNGQSSQSMAASVKSFVSFEAKTTFGNNKVSANMANSAARQTHHQYENHSTEGTLVISIMCTHKDAALLSPLVIDPDKAITSWNRMYKSDEIDTRHPEKVAKIAVGQGGSTSKNMIEIISGATYGSSFVAMVHVLNTKETETSQSMSSVAAQIQAQATRGWLFASVTGGFGLDASYSKALKSLLSTQEIQSHCNIVSMGSIPSIKANDVKMAVKEFTNFSGSEAMDKLAVLQNAQADGINTMNSQSGKAARTGGDMIALEASKVTSVMSAVGEQDGKNNKILDINSVMNAMDDYINKALEGNLGVPINYYLKAMSKDELAHLWINKYYPFFFTELLGEAKQDETGS